MDEREWLARSQPLSVSAALVLWPASFYGATICVGTAPARARVHSGSRGDRASRAKFSSWICIPVGPIAAYTGQKLAGKARITMEQARAIALKAHPGQIADEELEQERGGSGLRYSFDIKDGGVTQEVGVDAKTGRVRENKAEGPHPD